MGSRPLDLDLDMRFQTGAGNSARRLLEFWDVSETRRTCNEDGSRAGTSGPRRRHTRDAVFASFTTGMRCRGGVLAAMSERLEQIAVTRSRLIFPTFIDTLLTRSQAAGALRMSC